MKDALNLTSELEVCRKILTNILAECKEAESPDAELVTRASHVCRMTTQIQKLVYAIVKVEKLRNSQLSKPDVLAIATKIADVASNYIPDKRRAAFIEEVQSLIKSHE